MALLYNFLYLKPIIFCEAELTLLLLFWKRRKPLNVEFCWGHAPRPPGSASPRVGLPSLLRRMVVGKLSVATTSTELFLMGSFNYFKPSVWKSNILAGLWLRKSWIPVKFRVVCGISLEF
jgi:hypothetical protein